MRGNLSARAPIDNGPERTSGSVGLYATHGGDHVTYSGGPDRGNGTHAICIVDDAKGELGGTIVAELEQPVVRIAKLLARIGQLVAGKPEGGIIMRVPRAGRINVAQVRVRIHWRAWQNRTTHDPAQHAGAAKIAPG